MNLAVIVAMEVEEAALLARLPATEVWRLSERLGLSVRHCDGLWVLQSGVGAVNAAVGLALLLERHPVEAVLSLGVGGALDARLEVGDVVISRHVLQHDCLHTFEAGWEPMAPGHLHLSVPERPSPLLASDPALVEWMREVFPEARCGTVLSGSEFAASLGRKQELAGRAPDALLVEMEAAGLAQVCARAGLPFVAVKTVADRLHHSEEYLDVLAAAAEHAGRLGDWLAGCCRWDAIPARLEGRGS